MTTGSFAIPKAFIWRRLHSLMGLWLVLFLCEHLVTNSQAALWIGDSGKGFVQMVNALHNLPYLEVIEVTLLGFPILIHLVWGIKYLMTSRPNQRRTDGSTPSIPLPRNRAYSWQRITSWILLIGLIAHVVKFRFLEYPEKVLVGKQTMYQVIVSVDSGLDTVADRVGATLRHEAKGKVVAVTENFGTATLLTVRDTFKNPVYLVLYTIFVLAACFHAANGFWTFLLTWGWVLKMSAQRAWVTVSLVLMGGLVFLGMAAIWGTYWFNLRT